MAGGTDGECGRDGKGRRLILNPQSGRCVLRDGAAGRAILARGAKSTKPRSSGKPPSSPVSSSANLALAIALASRKRAPSPSASSPSPKRKTTTTSKKKKASPVSYNNNNNGGYSNSYSPSPTPRRGRGGIFGLPIKILSVVFAMAVAVKVAQWASTVLHGEAKKWGNLGTSLLSKIAVGPLQTGYDSAMAFFRKMKKDWKDGVAAPPPLNDSELKTYFQECCASKLAPTVSSFFLGAVKGAVKDIEDACQIPTDENVLRKWASLMRKVLAKTLSPKILDVMLHTLEKTDTSRVGSGWRIKLADTLFAVRQLKVKVGVQK